MEEIMLYTSISILLLILTYKLYHSIINKTHKRNLPPSPPSLPILGHLHYLKPPIHRTFLKLSQKYGPIMSLYFGSRLVVVVSSPSAVEECFTKNDVVLANRPKLPIGKHLSYNYNTISAAPYGDHWRNLRRIGSIEIFSTHRLNMFLSYRRDETLRLLRKLSSGSREDFAQVELKSMFSNLTLNIVMRMISGKRYFGDGVDEEGEAREFGELIHEIFRHGGASYPEDFLPLLKWVNGGRHEKELKELSERFDKFLCRLIDEHREGRKKGVERNTMIDHLLSLQESQPDQYPDEVIKGLTLVILLAGTDTSAVTLEWAMSNLVNHPHILHKAKNEIDSKIGQDRLIEESDLPKLPYLHNIISETLRLYPAAPLLVPHFSSQDFTIGPYNLPGETMVLVNAWAIHRDPVVWEDPEEFKPERFDDEQQEGGDKAYKLLPFGVGRRACPGAGMAQRVMGLALGALIQCFEWKRVREDELVDMREGRGVSMPKAQPLIVMCKTRDVIKTVLAEVDNNN